MKIYGRAAANIHDSFGNPNAQTPTPTQTPTSAVFPTSVFQTPQVNHNTYDNNSGWTPTFAEEYSVFNATPGRLITSQSPFQETFTPRIPGSSTQKQQFLRPAASPELAFHVHNNANQPHSPLPHLTTSQPLTYSPNLHTAHGRSVDDRSPDKTPNKPQRRLQEAFSGQTATPPQSAVKESRKRGQNSATAKMQRSQDSFFQPSGTPLQQSYDFAASSEDMFGYPMSAPATAPGYTNKSFWDEDSSMTEINMDFTSGDASSIFSTTHRMPNLVDWAQNNQMFQQQSHITPLEQSTSQSSRRHRPLLAKPPSTSAAEVMSNAAFDFAMATMPEDPFAMVASTGAVDPGLIFSFPQVSSPMYTQSKDVFAPIQPKPDINSTVHEPYQHQQRELQREKEELRRARSLRDKPEHKYDRAAFSSPAKGDRPNLRRAVSDSRPKKYTALGTGPLPTLGAPISTGESRSSYSRGRLSPVKQGSRTNLASIPESSGLNTRTSVTFSIDANGRARTETTIIVDPERSTRRPRSRISVDDWDSPDSGSSTDEEPIMIPSRNTSFNLPDSDSRSLPKVARFETSSRQSMDKVHRRNSFRKSSSLELDDSEGETIIDDDNTGDAANELRRVMESRRRSTIGMGSSQQQQKSRNPSRRSFPLDTAPYRRQSYPNQAYSNVSPTTVSDLDVGTPSTDRASTRSDSTRCVCNSRDGDEFMIQW
jgi:hypothetical protein